MRDSMVKLGVAAGLVLALGAAQARADRWHGGWGIGFTMGPPAPVYVAPPPVYYAPPPVYYAPPPPVYYAPPPPPVVYAPPPPVYSPGGMSLGVSIPLR